MNTTSNTAAPELKTTMINGVLVPNSDKQCPRQDDQHEGDSISFLHHLWGQTSVSLSPAWDRNDRKYDMVYNHMLQNMQTIESVFWKYFRC